MRELAILVGQKTPSPNNSLQELRQLADTAGADIAICKEFNTKKLTPNYFLSKGQVEELAEMVQNKGADLVVFDQELSSVQQRNIEEVVEVKIIDRTQLILDIFAQHAFTQEGKLEVELAQLNYLLPRLTGKGIELSRLGGGIGTRGPGETKLEYDRRRIRNRIVFLNKKIKKVSRQREIQRKRRIKNRIPMIALVGYTNSGKTTLVNKLSGSDLPAGDALFITLDSRMRKIMLPDNQKALLIDTVGFIKRLPHQLVASFQSTLEEVKYADILIQVIESSNSDLEEKERVVRKVLEELESLDKPMITVLNKTDLLSLEDRRQVRRTLPEGIFVSATKGEGIEEIKERLSQILKEGREELQLFLPQKRVDLLPFLYQESQVLEEKYEPKGIKIKVLVTPEVAGKLRQFRTKG